jgi:CRISPR/Cas system CSM-associated protein Csm4 (group 5 of RAMP superfamily)
MLIGFVSDKALTDVVKAEELLQRKVNEFKNISLSNEDERIDEKEKVSQHQYLIR